MNLSTLNFNCCWPCMWLNLCKQICFNFLNGCLWRLSFLYRQICSQCPSFLFSLSFPVSFCFVCRPTSGYFILLNCLFIFQSIWKEILITWTHLLTNPGRTSAMQNNFKPNTIYDTLAIRMYDAWFQDMAAACECNSCIDNASNQSETSAMNH